jgi:hypothetical protein
MSGAGPISPRFEDKPREQLPPIRTRIAIKAYGSSANLGVQKSFSLTVESRGIWRLGTQELSGLNHCDDVDLALTPATNTLPIRRLKLPIGGSYAIDSAWVRFPDLSVQPLSQRYTRLAKNTYRYESNTGFSAEIGVDDLGVLTTYPGGWERTATL